jgi:heptosyltransferase-2
MKTPKILIIQTAFVGDVILTTPVIDTLAENFEQAEIDFLTIPASVNLIETHPAVAHVYIFDKRGIDSGLKGLLRIAKEMRNRKYDICICPHRSLRSAFIARRTGAGNRIGFDKSAWKYAFTNRIRYRSDIHEIERNLSLLQPLGLDSPIRKPSVFPDKEDREHVSRIIAESGLADGDKIFAVAPGSVWATKRWPAPYYSEFCRMAGEYGWQPILIGSGEDSELCEEIVGKAGYGINFAGKFTLRQTGELLSRCQALLTNDSAPLHLGMAFDIPVFAIFGPTIPEFGFAPFGPKGFILERHDLGCRPCTMHGGKSCPINTFECMELIDPASVFMSVRSYFKIVPK